MKLQRGIQVFMMEKMSKQKKRRVDDILRELDEYTKKIKELSEELVEELKGVTDR